MKNELNQRRAVAIAAHDFHCAEFDRPRARIEEDRPRTRIVVPQDHQAPEINNEDLTHSYEIGINPINRRPGTAFYRRSRQS